MKKAICIILLIVIMIPFTLGCNSTDVSSVASSLDVDEYRIYEGDKEVAALEDWPTEKEFYLDAFGSYAFKDSELRDSELIYDFRGRDINTKRGIKAGSTFHEFAEAYNGVEVSFPSLGLTTTPEEFLKNQDEYKNEYKFLAVFSTYILKDGTKLSGSEKDNYLKWNNINVNDFMYNISEYCDEAYIMDIMFRDGSIKYLEIMDLIKTMEGSDGKS